MLVPVDLRDAFAWPEAAGELKTLASLSGDDLHRPGRLAAQSLKIQQIRFAL